MKKVIQRIEKMGLIPVVAIEEVEKAGLMAQALINGGLPCAEITFRTEAAASAIEKITETFPEMLVGAGTVLCVEQAKIAHNAGVKFIVTPGFDPAVVDYCLGEKLPVFPGVATPTDINLALNMGLDVLKFFPAEVMGGVKALKAISGPYNMVRFIPTGGINQNNILDYLSLSQVLACGGSWIVKGELIKEGKFSLITEMVQMAVGLVKQARSSND